MSADHIRAKDRQAGLERFLGYLRSIRNEEVLPSPVEPLSETTMLRSIFVGEYYRLQGDMDKAARWYLLATQSDPLPLWQDSLQYAWRDRLLPSGDILITDFANVDGWVLDSINSNVVDGTFECVDGVVYVSYQNRPDQRDIVAYSLYPEGGMQLGYHTVLSVRVKIEPGSFLTLEIKVDDNLERYLHYYQGIGEWEVLEFPLRGGTLQAIKLGTGEPGESKTTPVYSEVWIDWIKLELALD